MPKLIVNRPKRKAPTPPCGRRSDFVEPHSPFQILVDRKRQQLGYSTRHLALKISELLPSTGFVRQSTLWFWLHQKNGAPHPRAITSERLKAIAKTIGVTVDELKQSIDASRLLFNPGQVPPPMPSMDALDSLVEILSHDKRVTLSRDYVLNLIKNVRAGARYVTEQQK